MICVGETKNNGAEDSLTKTCVEASDKGNGVVVAVAVVAARLEPKRVAMDPGLTTPSLEKLAPFTTPFGATTGVAVPRTSVTVTACELDAPGAEIVIRPW